MKKIGNRGAKAWIDENTMASIKKAVKLGAQDIKIDVHCCKTGELVVIHDFTLDRTTNGNGKVNTKTLEQLSLLRTNNNHKIPGLKEVIEFCADKYHVHIELKGKKTTQKTALLIKQLIDNKKTTYSQITVSSFTLSKLKKIQQINPEIHLGLVANKNLKIKLKQCVHLKIPVFYPFYEKLKSKTVKKAKSLNIKTYCWTVNEKDDILRMEKIDVDGIISDYPEKL